MGATVFAGDKLDTEPLGGLQVRILAEEPGASDLPEDRLDPLLVELADVDRWQRRPGEDVDLRPRHDDSPVAGEGERRKAGQEDDDAALAPRI